MGRGWAGGGRGVGTGWVGLLKRGGGDRPGNWMPRPFHFAGTALGPPLGEKSTIISEPETFPVTFQGVPSSSAPRMIACSSKKGASKQWLLWIVGAKHENGGNWASPKIQRRCAWAG